MFLVLRLAVAMVCGACLGWIAETSLNWTEGPQVCAAAGAVGQAAFAAVAWIGRPNETTAKLQARVFTPWVVATLILALTAVTLLLQFPATVLSPAASYLLVRVLLDAQNRGHGAIGGHSLPIAARGGEILTVLAAIIRVQL